MSITQTEFNQQCIEFVLRSQGFDDNWSLISETSGQLSHSQPDKTNLNQLLNSKLILTKNEFKTNLVKQVQTWEYNILFSDSFEVPVMYFCVSNQDGSLASLDDFTTQLCKDHEDGIAQVISQVEHPSLFRPFFMIHPCRTKNFMEPHTKINRSKYLICWISTVGTMLDLKLDPRLAFH